MDKLTKSCAFCGKTFSKQANVSMKNWETVVKYCSRECYGKSKIIDKTKTCPGCGKQYEYKYWMKNQKYCSRECVSNARRKQKPLCELCGKPCKIHGRRFCSRDCKVQWMREDNHYAYLGDDAREFPHEVQWLKFWFQRADEIRERDKVCQHCGKIPKRNGRALDVHHVIPYRISKDNSSSNLIALCRSCHKKEDHRLVREIGH